MLKFGRYILGQVIVFISFITLPKAVKRSIDEQQKIDSEVEKMSLYQFSGCPFCVKTRRTLHKLALNMELRDASNDAEHRQMLAEQGGKIQTPCLRIDDENGTTWMYESKAIIAYLEEQFSPEAAVG